ncbi:MAG: hypothetical protein HY692_08330 [Cyanobacteria bacterium NC_groundwater_1444_Ag_S-0.65um_54_12]|nr:hypothetical protein [Cyanobacteria bacterium NC_groundwater_1444_Ag_S-0.65um_54_12]
MSHAIAQLTFLLVKGQNLLELVLQQTGYKNCGEVCLLPEPKAVLGIRPAVPPPPPSYAPLTRVTSPLTLRDTRPLAWVEIARRLGRVESLDLRAEDGTPRRRNRPLAQSLQVIREKIESFFRRSQ